MDQKALVSDRDHRKEALSHIDAQFGVGDSVKHLRSMMKQVTAKEVTAETVNAACNCISNVNNTITTAIKAARYLAER